MTFLGTNAIPYLTIYSITDRTHDSHAGNSLINSLSSLQIMHFPIAIVLAPRIQSFSLIKRYAPGTSSRFMTVAFHVPLLSLKTRRLPFKEFTSLETSLFFSMNDKISDRSLNGHALPLRISLHFMDSSFTKKSHSFIFKH